MSAIEPLITAQNTKTRHRQPEEFPFVAHNYVTLNIGEKPAVEQSAAYFLERNITGTAIGLSTNPQRRTDQFDGSARYGN